MLSGRSSAENIPDPCSDMNGGCQHICMFSEQDQGVTCGCEDGYHLTEDGRTCEGLNAYYVHVIGNQS